MSATGRRGKANKHWNTSYVFFSFLYALLEPIFFRRFIKSLGVVQPTPGDRDAVAEHGPDDSYLAAITGVGEVGFGLDLTLLIGKPY